VKPAASLLDRLADGMPFLELGVYKERLARDLETLLNTRAAPAPAALGDSILAYGLPDLSSLSLLDPGDRLRLAGRIQSAIQRFEPRLADVLVGLEIPRDRRVLRFRVDALLAFHPRRPPVRFDALLQTATGACRVNPGG
jgi:type VI secretion system protein ImpF